MPGSVYISEILDNIEDPLGCWDDINSSITKPEIDQYLLTHKNIWCGEDYVLRYYPKRSMEEMREDHVRKIAYFIRNPDHKPILLDTMPGAHLIYDGHHRLCTAICRGQTTISASVTGCVEDIENYFPKSIADGLLKLDEDEPDVDESIEKVIESYKKIETQLKNLSACQSYHALAGLA
jgi:hypothetical protein